MWYLLAALSDSTFILRFPGGSAVKNLPAMQGFYPGARKPPWRRKWQPTPVFLPGESHGQRSLVGYSLWGSKWVGYDWATKQQQQVKTQKDDCALSHGYRSFASLTIHICPLHSQHLTFVWFLVSSCSYCHPLADRLTFRSCRPKHLPSRPSIRYLETY